MIPLERDPDDYPEFTACTVCSWQGVRSRAKYVATEVSTEKAPMQWFECGKHGEFEHSKCLDEHYSRELQPLDEWREFVRDQSDADLMETVLLNKHREDE